MKPHENYVYSAHNLKKLKIIDLFEKKIKTNKLS